MREQGRGEGRVVFENSFRNMYREAIKFSILPLLLELYPIPLPSLFAAFSLPFFQHVITSTNIFFFLRLLSTCSLSISCSLTFLLFSYFLFFLFFSQRNPPLYYNLPLISCPSLSTPSFPSPRPLPPLPLPTPSSSPSSQPLSPLRHPHFPFFTPSLTPPPTLTLRL